MALVFNGRCLTRPIGGVERYARQLLRILARTTTDLRVVVPGNAPADLGVPAGIPVVRVGRMRGHAWEQLQLPRSLAPDDVLFCPANTAPLRVRRQAVVVHDLAWLHHPEGFDARFVRWYGFLLPRVVRRAAVVITVSEAMRAELLMAFSLPPDRVQVVPPHADATQFATAEPVDVPPGFVLLVGADDPRKEVGPTLDMLLEARPRAHVVVAGRHRRSFTTTERRQDERITWLPDARDAQLTWLYDHASALLHPSRYEGFGLPVLEALQRGCPVVARPIPALREMAGAALHDCAFTGSADLAAVLDRVPPRGPATEAAMVPIAQRYNESRTELALRAAMVRIPQA